jgi:hypothetical protein
VFATADAPDRPTGVQVLDVREDGIAQITVFLDEAIARRF